MAGRREAWNERAPLIKEKTERKNEDFFLRLIKKSIVLQNTDRLTDHINDACASVIITLINNNYAL